MDVYLNPGNSGFASIIKSDYVDKTGLIALLNKTIGTTRKLTCVTRPRRFGKSFAAQMLCAYYDKTCDSHSLFAGYEIADNPTYEEHIGKYDVIYWDMAGVKPYTERYSRLVPFLIESLKKELKEQYPDVEVSEDLPAGERRHTCRIRRIHGGMQL